jgi:cytochrome P450
VHIHYGRDTIMITATKPQHIGWTILNGCLYPFKKIAQGISYALNIDDSIKIARQKENFFFNEFASRSINGGKGYASTYFGLPLLHVYNFFVFTGKDFVKEAVAYGEYDKDHPELFDPKARILFEPIKDFLGDPAIVNMNGPEVAKERLGIKNYLSPHRAQTATWEVTDKILENWSDEKSLNHTICLLCTRVIAQGWFNLKDVPEDLIPLLKTAEHYVFNRDKVSADDFEKLRAKIQTLNDKFLTTQKDNLSEEHSYLGFLKNHRGKKSVTDLNGLAALLVEGNITTVLTGAVLQLATNPNLQERLRQELKTLDPLKMRTPDGYDAIKRLPLLHQIYLEALRYYSPSPPMARYASKAGNINGVHIPARSYIFIPLRQVMHNPNQWTNPSIFDPGRHQVGNSHLNQFPLVPFSEGPRVCPASFGFAESTFKIGLVQIFRENQLNLTSHDSVEQIPVAIKEPRFTKAYLGSFRKVSQDTDPQKVLQFNETKSHNSSKELTTATTVEASPSETFAIAKAKPNLRSRSLNNLK